MLKDILNKQNFLIKKVKNYQTNLKKKPSSSIQSIDYFCTFGETPGYALQKFWLNKIGSLFLIIKTILKDVYSIFNYLDYEVISSGSKKNFYDKIIITWATKKNFHKNIYKDKYFNKAGITYIEEKETHWSSFL